MTREAASVQEPPGGALCGRSPPTRALCRATAQRGVIVIVIMRVIVIRVLIIIIIIIIIIIVTVIVRVLSRKAWGTRLRLARICPTRICWSRSP